MADMFHLASEGKYEEAEAINDRLMTLHKNLFVEASPIPVKWAAEKLGLIEDGSLRLPLTTLSENLQPIVEQALIDARIYKD